MELEEHGLLNGLVIIYVIMYGIL